MLFRSRLLNYGSSGTGSSIHLTSELLKTAAKIEMTHVPYKGSGPAAIDLMAGQIQVLFSSTVSTLPHVKSGKVRGLAITSLKRAQALPDVPTTTEAGVPEYKVSGWFALLAPGGTPRPILERLNKEVNAALTDPVTKAAFEKAGAETIPMPLDVARTFHADEIKKYREIITKAGIERIE